MGRTLSSGADDEAYLLIDVDSGDDERRRCGVVQPALSATKQFTVCAKLPALNLACAFISGTKLYLLVLTGTYCTMTFMVTMNPGTAMTLVVMRLMHGNTRPGRVGIYHLNVR